MMECTKIKKLLPDYSVFVSVAKARSETEQRSGSSESQRKHGGGLSKKNREFVKQHLDNCPDCSRELILLDKTASLLEKIPQEEPPDFLWEGISRGIIQQESRIKSQPIWQKVIGWIWGKRIPTFATGLVVSILVTALYFAVWNSPKESQPTLYAEIEQQTFSYWNSPFADRAALGMLVMNTSLEGENDETSR